jgi:MoxR-like ATPase
MRDARPSGAKQTADVTYRVRGADRAIYAVTNGVVRRTHWPVIVLTSNGERTFPAPFLRRCVRFEMPVATESFIRAVVGQYFDNATEQENETISAFARRLVEGQSLALDQLLNYLHVVTGEAGLDPASRDRVSRILLEQLRGK